MISSAARDHRRPVLVVPSLGTALKEGHQRRQTLWSPLPILRERDRVRVFCRGRDKMPLTPVPPALSRSTGRGSNTPAPANSIRIPARPSCLWGEPRDHGHSGAWLGWGLQMACPRFNPLPCPPCPPPEYRGREKSNLPPKLPSALFLFRLARYSGRAGKRRQ